MDPVRSVIMIQRVWRRHNSSYIVKLDWALNGRINGMPCTTKIPNINKLEKLWGNRMINQSGNNQWTTLLGEGLVKQTLERRGINTWKPKRINKYSPDLETEDAIIEVKTRNWTTSGTAGEKVFGVPYKYSDIPRLYNKPLKIVCVAFQEYELTHGNSNVFGDEVSDEKKYLLQVWKSMGIEFVKFSDMVTIVT